MVVEHKNIDEIIIRCPVCGEFLMGCDEYLSTKGQLRFQCKSKKCRGKIRYINAQSLDKIIDKATTSGIVAENLNAVS